MVRMLGKKTNLKKKNKKQKKKKQKKKNKNKNKKKKVERRRWDEGGVLYRFADAWVVWKEGWKELKKKKKWDNIYDTWEG